MNVAGGDLVAAARLTIVGPTWRVLAALLWPSNSVTVDAPLRVAQHRFLCAASDRALFARTSA
jgi:hypothetical protein